MGVAFKTDDLGPRRTIALKFSSHQGLGNPKEKAQLLREPEGACVLY
jgi:hypothetical protein